MPAENGMPENEDVKKKALLRLAIAGIVTAAALAGLWWLDQSGNEAKKPQPVASPPAPIVSAPQPEIPAPETEPSSADEEMALPDEEAADAPGLSELNQEAPPPPPRVSNSLRPTPSSPALSPAVSPRTLTVPAPTNVPQTKPSLAPPPTRQPDLGKGYVVQLGVFSNPENARELVDKLNKQGIRAYLEARVQIGPFQNRQEAETAQIEMRKLGYNPLVTLPYSALPATK